MQIYRMHNQSVAMRVYMFIEKPLLSYNVRRYTNIYYPRIQKPTRLLHVCGSADKMCICI